MRTVLLATLLIAPLVLVATPTGSAHCALPTSVECVWDWGTNVEGWKRFVCNVTNNHAICLYQTSADASVALLP